MSELKAGRRLQADGSSAEVIIVRAPAETGDFTFQSCVGDLVLGKRYCCGSCGAEALVVVAGNAAILCHGDSMRQAEPKSLPSSD